MVQNIKKWIGKHKRLSIGIAAIAAVALIAAIAIPLSIANAENAAEHRANTANDLRSQIADAEHARAIEHCEAEYEEHLAALGVVTLLPAMERLGFLTGDGRSAIPKDEREAVLEQLREARTVLQEEPSGEALAAVEDLDLEALDALREECVPDVATPESVDAASAEEIEALEQELADVQNDTVEPAEWVAAVNGAFDLTAEALLTGVEATATPNQVKEKHEHADNSFYRANRDSHNALDEAMELASTDDATVFETTDALDAWRQYVVNIGKTIENSKENENSGGDPNDPVNQQNPNNPNNPNGNNNNGNNNPPSNNNNNPNPPNNNNNPNPPNNDDNGGGNNNPPPPPPPTNDPQPDPWAVCAPNGTPAGSGVSPQPGWTFTGGTFTINGIVCDRYAPPSDDW